MSETHSPAPANAVFVLSTHATYGCRDRGACCTAGWPIPIEVDALSAAEAAIASGRLLPVVRDTPPFGRPAAAPADTPATVGVSRAGCVFHHTHGTARCELHRTLGHAALPLACRQFPRIVVRDPRGVSVTLSHFCPTAAALLDTPGDSHIVGNSDGFTAESLTGLDVRTGLPPQLRPDMLMDWASWWRLEERAVLLLAGRTDPEEGMARLAVAVEQARTWRPADGLLIDRVNDAFDCAESISWSRRARASVTDIVEAVPEDFRRDAMAALARTGATTSPLAHRHFLVAHVFGSWTAHLGEGLRTWLRSIETAHALIGAGLSVGDADLLLRHLADPHRLAKRWGGAEREYPAAADATAGQKIRPFRARRPARTASGSRRPTGS